MTPEELRTLTLFNTVESRPEINQRQLAQELDVSLGLANTYFQRVLKKGWVRAQQVKPRRWLYFLTPQGVLEKSRLSLSYLHRTLESFRELKSKGDEQLSILSEKGVQGIHLCGEDDLTEVLSYCFSGFEIELLSVISEKSLLANSASDGNPSLPELKSGERILLASLEHRASLTELLTQQGLKKNQHWVLFS
ncbi:MAG: winged helix-turn-helix transcriptional regulator [SAR324 cluster bacterium]|nr:winged helix-turn-helix transcriptional regulator [SAR324 cluster bacterium]MBL7036206.1 winged helix-turn-helix transcriptional regulator [SAR324 cluster bacterium]